MPRPVGTMPTKVHTRHPAEIANAKAGEAVLVGDANLPGDIRAVCRWTSLQGIASAPHRPGEFLLLSIKLLSGSPKTGGREPRKSDQRIGIPKTLAFSGYFVGKDLCPPLVSPRLSKSSWIFRTSLTYRDWTNSRALRASSRTNFSPVGGTSSMGPPPSSLRSTNSTPPLPRASSIQLTSGKFSVRWEIPGQLSELLLEQEDDTRDVCGRLVGAALDRQAAFGIARRGTGRGCDQEAGCEDVGAEQVPAVWPSAEALRKTHAQAGTSGKNSSTIRQGEKRLLSLARDIAVVNGPALTVSGQIAGKAMPWAGANSA